MHQQRGRSCSNCGAAAYDASARWCTKCGTLLTALPQRTAFADRPQVVVVRAEKNPALAAFLLMLWVGLGHIYDGKLLMGIGFMIAYPVVAVLAWFGLFAALAGNGGGFLLFLAWPSLWLWAAVSAYKNAKRQNIQAAYR